MDKVIKIILQLLAALALFLCGWLAHSWKNRGQVKNEVEKAIKEMNEEHERALKALKREFNERINEKDEIIRRLKNIIDRLLRQIQPLQGTGAYGVDSLICKLNSSKDELNKL